MPGIVTYLFSSECGEIELASFKDSLIMCDWTIQPRHQRVLSKLEKALGCSSERGTSPVIEKALVQLEEYFKGKRKDFDIPVLLIGTPLQKKVWNALLDLGYGSVVSYSDLAITCGCPRSVRPVASCVGANPVSILVPCHRVIGKTGSLTGYAGGLPAKKYLLTIEKSLL